MTALHSRWYSQLVGSYRPKPHEFSILEQIVFSTLPEQLTTRAKWSIIYGHELHIPNALSKQASG
jgi:hypothetical protein